MWTCSWTKHFNEPYATAQSGRSTTVKEISHIFVQQLESRTKGCIKRNAKCDWVFAFLSSERKPFLLKPHPPNRTLLLSINFSVNALVVVTTVQEWERTRKGRMLLCTKRINRSLEFYLWKWIESTQQGLQIPLYERWHTEGPTLNFRIVNWVQDILKAHGWKTK